MACGQMKIYPSVGFVKVNDVGFVRVNDNGYWQWGCTVGWLRQVDAGEQWESTVGWTVKMNDGVQVRIYP